MNVLPDGSRSDRILVALQDQRPGIYLQQLSAIVGKKGHPGKVLRKVWVGSAKARLQLSRKLWAIRIPHDHRGHHSRPAKVIAVQELKKVLDVGPLEAAWIAIVI